MMPSARFVFCAFNNRKNWRSLNLIFQWFVYFNNFQVNVGTNILLAAAVWIMIMAFWTDVYYDYMKLNSRYTWGPFLYLRSFFLQLNLESPTFYWQIIQTGFRSWSHKLKIAALLPKLYLLSIVNKNGYQIEIFLFRVGRQLVGLGQRYCIACDL